MSNPIQLDGALAVIDHVRKHHKDVPGVDTILMYVDLAEMDWKQAIEALKGYAALQTWVLERKEGTGLADTYDCLEWAGREKRARAKLMSLAEALTAFLGGAGKKDFVW